MEWSSGIPLGLPYPLHTAPRLSPLSLSPSPCSPAVSAEQEEAGLEGSEEARITGHCLMWGSNTG